jgi:hypothetical protein
VALPAHERGGSVTITVSVSLAFAIGLVVGVIIGACGVALFWMHDYRD